MEGVIKLSKPLKTYGELEETSQLYYNCVNVDEINKLEHLSLKYCLWNLNLLEVFKSRTKSMNTDIEKLKENIKNYKGTKIDTNKEMEKLDEIYAKLIAMEKEATDECYYYCDYLGRAAKKYDTLNDDIVKNVYLGTSEDIIKLEIQKYLNYEKSFLIFNDIIKQLKILF